MNYTDKIRTLWVLRTSAGGMRTHINKVLNQLSANTCRVTVAAPMKKSEFIDPSNDYSVLDQWHVLPKDYASSPVHFLKARNELSGLINSGYHLMHAHGLAAGLLTRLSRSRTNSNLPVLVSLHNVVPEKGLKNVALSYILSDRCIHVCAVSRAVAASAAVRRMPIYILPNGNENRSVVRIAGDRIPKLLFVGRLSQEKGFDVLLRALAKIKSERWVLSVVGDGPMSAAYRKQARIFRLQDRVVWYGWQDDVTPYYRKSDLLIVPSRSEAAGLVIGEAMSYGIPPVASNVGGISEYIEHAINGWLVSPEDPEDLATGLVRLIKDPQLRRQMGRQARRVSRQLPRWRQVAKRLELIYRNVGCPAMESIEND